MEEKEVIKVGSVAPDFSLSDQHKELFKLSEFKGKKVLLSFHPLAWTPVCAKQMLSLEENDKTFHELNTVAVGLSIDAVPSKNAWAESLKITKTRLLSDFWEHGSVAQKYGIFREKDGFSQRANILLDEKQTIIFVKTYPISQLPDINEIIQFIESQ